MGTTIFDATILLEEPPAVEVIDGLVYITDRVGGLVIRRCFRPRTFYETIQSFVEVSRQFDIARRGGAEIIPLHAARPAAG
jgi:hypothetical protein